jgi:hypothetical protein
VSALAVLLLHKAGARRGGAANPRATGAGRGGGSTPKPRLRERGRGLGHDATHSHLHQEAKEAQDRQRGGRLRGVGGRWCQSIVQAQRSQGPLFPIPSSPSALACWSRLLVSRWQSPVRTISGVSIPISTISSPLAQCRGHRARAHGHASPPVLDRVFLQWPLGAGREAAVVPRTFCFSKPQKVFAVSRPAARPPYGNALHDPRPSGSEDEHSGDPGPRQVWGKESGLQGLVHAATPAYSVGVLPAGTQGLLLFSVVISKSRSLAITASQPVEYQQHSHEVCEKKHDMEALPSKRLEEVNAMTPLYTLLLCLPAALVLLVCGCGLAALWSPAAQPTDRLKVGRQRGRSSAG